jgi:hypothetical protein
MRTSVAILFLGLVVFFFRMGSSSGVNSSASSYRPLNEWDESYLRRNAALDKKLEKKRFERFTRGLQEVNPETNEYLRKRLEIINAPPQPPVAVPLPEPDPVPAAPKKKKLNA